MDMFTSSFFWVSLAQIMMINILLSGDNAVVIAMASRALPPRQQRSAILFGSFGAIVLRVILTFFAVALLALPYLKIIGAILLGWIGIQLLIPDDAEAELDGHSNLWGAIKTIIVADFVMSLDNVLGVAAAAKGNIVLLVIGLGVSIPLIIYGSTMILKLMNRFPIIITAGGGLLGWVAGEMLITDPAISGWTDVNASWLHMAAPALGMAFVVGAGKWLAREKPEPATVVADLEKLEREPAPPGYHWVSRPWRILPDGSRDYAHFHGEREFRRLVPNSSRLRESGDPSGPSLIVDGLLKDGTNKKE
jgi:YjbE family integral membrane protein